MDELKEKLSLLAQEYKDCFLQAEDPKELYDYGLELVSELEKLSQ